MPLSSSVSTPPLADLPHRLAHALQDMANSLTIQPDLCIQHPQYQPFQVPSEVLSRFETLPVELKQKFLTLQLRTFLYGIYYSGSLQASLAPESPSERQPQFQDLENSTFLGIDLEFVAQLHEANVGKGYFDPGWQVVQQLSDDSFTVHKGGLTLYIDAQQHLAPEVTAIAGKTVAIRLPRNLMQNGFYMAVGDAGKQQAQAAGPVPNPIVRVYFNLTSQGAVAVMGALTQSFNTCGLPFTFKVLYNPSDYQRYDAGVLYIDYSSYAEVRQLLQPLYETHQAHFRPLEPLFTKHLAPGLGLAEEPDRTFSHVESFGQNRCQIVANALLEAETFRERPDHAEQRLDMIQQHFQQVGLDLARPYLNAGSHDIYAPLSR
ncbi:MAG: T3SS effector HopA1 family protein [Cyanobacteria bacterium P01_G01_bin.38]